MSQRYYLLIALLAVTGWLGVSAAEARPPVQAEGGSIRGLSPGIGVFPGARDC